MLMDDGKENTIMINWRYFYRRNARGYGERSGWEGDAEPMEASGNQPRRAGGHKSYRTRTGDAEGLEACTPHAGRRARYTVEDLSMLRLELDKNPERADGIIGAIDFLPTLRTRWEGNRQGGIWLGCHLSPAQRIGGRLGLCWRRGHAKRRQTVDGQRRTRSFWRNARAVTESTKGLCGRCR
jgi:hypothetical protein